MQRTILERKGTAVLTQVGDLREFKIFEELNDRELEVIAKIARTEELGEGARLTETGTPAARLYLIKEGSVTIMASGPHGEDLPVDEVGPGEIVGWSTLTGPYIYRASAVTARTSEVIVINGNLLREVFEVNNHIGYRVLKGIGHVVARRMAAIEAKCAARGAKE